MAWRKPPAAAGSFRPSWWPPPGPASRPSPGADPIGVWVFAVVLGGWVITLCLHEFAHAAVSYLGGDTSVRARGYLTLNPLRYTDLAYSVIIPILLLAVGGIPLPGGAVLVEPGRLRRRWYASLVSAAGPATNMVAGVVLAVIGAGFTDRRSGAALSYLALLQFVAGHPQPVADPRFRRLRHHRAVPVLPVHASGSGRCGRGSRWSSSRSCSRCPAPARGCSPPVISCSIWPVASNVPGRQSGARLFRFWA